jgi:hypothetical protein
MHYLKGLIRHTKETGIKMNTKRKIAFMQKYLETKTTHYLEHRLNDYGREIYEGDGDWTRLCDTPLWDFYHKDYRLVPKRSLEIIYV